MYSMENCGGLFIVLLSNLHNDINALEKDSI